MRAGGSLARSEFNGAELFPRKFSDCAVSPLVPPLSDGRPTAIAGTAVRQCPCPCPCPARARAGLPRCWLPAAAAVPALGRVSSEPFLQRGGRLVDPRGDRGEYLPHLPGRGTGNAAGAAGQAGHFSGPLDGLECTGPVRYLHHGHPRRADDPGQLPAGTTRPPALTTRRSHSCASSMWCVVTSTPAPDSAASRIVSHGRVRASGSTPDVGSSRTSRSGGGRGPARTRAAAGHGLAPDEALQHLVFAVQNAEPEPDDADLIAAALADEHLVRQAGPGRACGFRGCGAGAEWAISLADESIDKFGQAVLNLCGAIATN